jgi:hypothetical protein
VGVEQGPLSHVSTTEELLGRNRSGSGLENREYGHGYPLRWPHDTLSILKVGHSVGIVRLRTEATEFFFVLFCCTFKTTVTKPMYALLSALHQDINF